MTDLTTLRQQRDAARKGLVARIGEDFPLSKSLAEMVRTLDTLLRLEGDLRVLEAAEALEKESKVWRRNKALWMPDDIIAFLRTLIPEGR